MSFKFRDRVELKPHLDDWMAGDRYGTVLSNSLGMVSVFLDKSGTTKQFNPEDLRLVNAPRHGNAKEI